MRSLLLVGSLLTLACPLLAQRTAPAVTLEDRPALDVVVGDLATPQLFEVKQGRYNLRVRQQGDARPVQLRAFFGKLESTRAQGWRSSAVVTAAEEVVGVIADGGPMTVAFFDATTKDDAPLVVGPRPRAEDPLSAWELPPRTLIVPARPAAATLLSPAALSTLWLGIDPAWMLFNVNARSCSGQLEAGEPVLLLETMGAGADPRRSGAPTILGARVLRANGATALCSGGDVAGLRAARPAVVTMPPAVAYGPPADFWVDEGFDAADAAVRAYATKKAAAWGCAEREWRRLDPDGRAGHYDVVTRDSAGRVQGVESLWAQTERKVWAACKIEPLARERERLGEKHASKASSQSRAHLARVAARLAPPK